MVRRALSPCTYAGCGALARGPRCDAHRTQPKRAFDARRGSSARRGYGSRWQKARTTYLSRNPVCVECAKGGVVTPASVVDHVVPVNAGGEFWDTSNWQALCAACHNSTKQRQDIATHGRRRA